MRTSLVPNAIRTFVVSAALLLAPIGVAAVDAAPFDVEPAAMAPIVNSDHRQVDGFPWIR